MRSGEFNVMLNHQKDGTNSFDQGHTNAAFTLDNATKVTDKENKEEKENKEHNGDDPWTIPENADDGEKWEDMTCREKATRVIINISKLLVVLLFLYLFICSLDFLASAFRLIAGKTTSDIMSNKEYLGNPVVGLMIGILVTVLVQSSSTSTSIIVSMVSADMISVHDAIPMIMGSNIGTSVTNTIVSLTQVGDRDEFRRAFAGATVHDMFNWLSVIVLLIIELATGMLEYITGAIVDSDALSGGGGGEVKILKVITEPFTNLVVQLDKEVLNAWSINCMVNVTSLIKTSCSKKKPSTSSPLPSTILPSTTLPSTLLSSTVTTEMIPADPCPEDPGEPDGTCKFLFYDTSLTDMQIGIILLIASLIILCTALIIIVKILNSIMKGKMALIIKKTINAEVPYLPWITGYIAILVGAFMTFIVQSSSIFTSTLTPLIGIGVITIERAYPLTLGSNIGTTTTALLASMAGESTTILNAIQIALVHLFFNIFGILLFYPIPFMRFPIPLAKKLGDTTAKYRWFAVLYLFVMFFFLPGFVFILSLGGALALGIVGIPIILIFVIVVIINIIQAKRPSCLPPVLRNWDWLPRPLHSLQPYDACCLSLPCCKSCRNGNTEELDSVAITKNTAIKQNSVDNQAFDDSDTKF